MTISAGKTIARHAYGWLAAANAVGVLLAAMLIWPGMNDFVAPFTYGRWMPLHLDWHLYGWCALPLVAVLYSWFLPLEEPSATQHGRIAVWAWSLALALCGVGWLAGVASGKLFVDAAGWTRPLLPLAMGVLWIVLAYHSLRRLPLLGRSRAWAQLLTLLVLSVVPLALYFAGSPGLFPSVNPDSGGATGASLLGSTLGVVAIAGALPGLLAVRRLDRPGSAALRRFYWFLFLLSAAVYAVTRHGHESHHSTAQIVALGTLGVWGVWLPVHFRQYSWPASARLWLRGAACWWVLLIASGWLTFLPGISEQLKFSHALVAHAHLALAGVVTSAGAAILATVGRPPWGGAASFWAWQVGCALHVIVLATLGSLEAAHADAFFTGADWIVGLLALRLLAGAIMFITSIAWLRPVAP